MSAGHSTASGSAPRVPAGPNSFAARAKRSLYNRLIVALEPWYDWGSVLVTNMDATSYAEEVEGNVRYFDVQWLGLHVGFQFGLRPRARKAVRHA